jgi:hypothetical protein
MSGHGHQSRLLRLGGTITCGRRRRGAVLPEQAQPTFGAKRYGIVALTLADGALPEPELIEPPGLRQLTMTIDLPDPCRH